ARLHPDLFDHFLGSEVRDRVLSDKHHRTQPFWFFPAVLIGGTMPWTPVFLIGLWKLFGGLRRRPADEATRAEGDVGRFNLAWIVGPFILFQLSRSKLITYLLPLMPFCALAVAGALAAICRRPGTERARRASMLAMAAGPVLAVLAGTGFAILGLGAPMGPWIAISAAFVAACAVALRITWQPGARRVLAAACIITAGSLAWGWIGLSLTGGRRSRWGRPASRSWVRDALSGAEVRGAPIRRGVRPESRPATEPPETFAVYDLKTNSLPFYLLGMRPEAFVNYGNPEE